MFQGTVLLSLLQKGNKPQRLLGQDVKRVTCGDTASSSLADGFLTGSCDSNSLHVANILPGFVAL